MKNTFFHVSLLAAACVVLLLAGCRPQYWYMTASKSGDTVQLCLSNELTCPQTNGVSPSSIAVYRWDSMHDNQLVWDAEPDAPKTNGRISGLIRYGIPPTGWINKTAPSALICGKAYQVVPGDKLFGLKCDGSLIVMDFPHLEYFFRNLDPPDGWEKRSRN